MILQHRRRLVLYKFLLISKQLIGKIYLSNYGRWIVWVNAKALYEYSKMRKKNTISQNFKTDTPNQVWVSDITYFNYSNYISRSFCLYLKELGVVQSFSRSGKPYDNAVCEAFFRCMKSEELYRYKYKSEREFRKSVSDYVEYYNTQRPHTYLGYLSPDKYERLHAKNSD